MSMLEPILSVIIPVYNTEAYLRECLDSVIDQTLQDFEVVCVNDGSTDGSLSILEEYRARDPRFTLISQENRGLSAARNCGLGHARGEYIYFLDSDDTIDPDLFRITTSLATEKALDAVAFEKDTYYESEEYAERYPQSVTRRLESATDVCTGVEFAKERRLTKTYYDNVCVVVWRRSFLLENHLLFKEGLLYEDNLFTFQAWMAASRVVMIPGAYYHHRLRASSITTGRKTAANPISFFRSIEGVLEYAFPDPCDPDKDYLIWRQYSILCRKLEKTYRFLPPKEKAKVVFPREIENELFQLILTRAQPTLLQDKLELELEVDRQKKEIARLQRRLDGVHASFSYRIGRIITWLPRRLRAWARSFGKR